MTSGMSFFLDGLDSRGFISSEISWIPLSTTGYVRFVIYTLWFLYRKILYLKYDIVWFYVTLQGEFTSLPFLETYYTKLEG